MIILDESALTVQLFVKRFKTFLCVWRCSNVEQQPPLASILHQTTPVGVILKSREKCGHNEQVGVIIDGTEIIV